MPVSDPPVPDVSPIPIVGIGASAGGIDALQRFFRALPAETGMAFVVVLHLAPDRESGLADILQACTDMTVEQAADGTEVRPDHVYVIAPGHHLTLRTGVLRVSTSTDRHNVATVDRFFRSLADDQGRNAVGIVLSGAGSDGTIGLRAINEHGGVAFAQAPEDADYDAMPQSAIATGLVDLVAPAGPLAETLVAYRNRAGSIQVPKRVDQLGDDEQSSLQKILARLYTVTGHDFTHYDHAMVLRRLRRRLHLSGAQSMDEYHRRLQNDAEETRALHRDLLVRVTNFFRAPEVFAALKDTVIPTLFAGKDWDDQVRVWVPGCATGEEAYSLAMLLVEHANTLQNTPELQVFATDVDEAALDVGRERRYPDAIAADVPEDRLRRFFEKKGPHYRVAPRLREIILFSGHDVLTDPPFWNVDLVSCRNLLVYLNDDAKEQVYNRFHYSLNEDGYLLLGRNEPTRGAEALFSTVDQANSILQARPGAATERTFAPFGKKGSGGRTVPGPTVSPSKTSENDRTARTALAQVHRQVLMDTVASLLVNDNEEIVHLTDGASRYLRFDEGTPSRSLLALVSGALRPELRSALYQVFEKDRSVERTGLPVPVEGATRLLRIAVQPVERDSGERLAHVRIEERPQPAPEDSDSSETGRPEPDGESPPGDADDRRAELERTREQLQTTTEEYEAVWEQLELSNEQLLSANEKLRSKNQELETRRQELMSLNEELQTTNAERKAKIEELREANSVLENLMAATEIATLFLDPDLRIQRFTPRVTELFNVQPTDVGRPLTDFTQRFEYEALIEDARAALYDLESIERELHTSDNKWFLLRVGPYRTVDDNIEGVVLSFIDITELKDTQEELRRERDFVDRVLDTVGALVVVVDEDRRLLRVNNECEAVTGYTSEALYEMDWMDRLIPEDKQAEVQEMLSRLWAGEAPIQFEIPILTTDGDERLVAWTSTVLRDESGTVQFAIGTGVDVTERRALEQAVIDAGEEVRREIGQDLHDVLSSDLAALAMKTDNLRRRIKKELIERTDAVDAMTDLIEGIRTAAKRSRTLSHALIPVALQEEHLAAALENLCREQEDLTDLSFMFEGDREEHLPRDEETAMHLYRIAHEALTNVRRHAQADRVWVSLRRVDDQLVMTVRDDGVGLPDTIDSSGGGVGLRSMDYRASIVGAALAFESGDEGGTVVRCALPLDKARSE